MDKVPIALAEFLREGRGGRPVLSVTRAGGPDRANLMRMEKGERLPSVPTLKWLCEYYGISFEQGLHLLQAARLERDLAAVAD
jgi:transcriptional regulator with XRE-family HTH domain